jgi:hypothetical protein
MTKRRKLRTRKAMDCEGHGQTEGKDCSNRKGAKDAKKKIEPRMHADKRR